MFINRVDESFAFGVSAEGLPGDKKPDLERALGVSGGLVRGKGLLDHLQLAWARRFYLGLRQVGADGDPHGAIRKHASPERVQARFEVGVPSMDM